MACMHDPRSGQKGHIDANVVVERRLSKTGKETIWSGGYGGGGADKQYSIVVTLDQAAFGGEIEYVFVDARECGCIAKLEGVGGSRVGYIGELHRRGGPHVVLVPSHGGCSSAEC